MRKEVRYVPIHNPRQWSNLLLQTDWLFLVLAEATASLFWLTNAQTEKIEENGVKV